MSAKPKQLVLVDLDRTLFDSDRFYVDICRLLANAKLIPQLVLTESIKQLGAATRSLYLTELIKSNHLNPGAAFDLVRPQLEPNAYLHPDVPNFLNHFKAATMVIITTGEYDYQNFKFQLSPLLAKAQLQVISTLDKGAYIDERLKNQNAKLSLDGITPGEWFDQVYFIDDRAYNFNSLVNKNNVKLYHILRTSGKASVPFAGPGVSIVNDLKHVI